MSDSAGFVTVPSSYVEELERYVEELTVALEGCVEKAGEKNALLKGVLDRLDGMIAGSDRLLAHATDARTKLEGV